MDNIDLTIALLLAYNAYILKELGRLELEYSGKYNQSKLVTQGIGHAS